MELLCIVEGHGEVAAIPPLVRKTLSEIHEIHYCDIDVQRRRGLDHLKANNWAHLRRYLEAAFYEERPILWLFDCDDCCPSQVLYELYRHLRDHIIRQPLAFALWYREYETIFLHDQQLLRTFCNDSAESPAEPAQIRDAKGWITNQMPKGTTYKETVNQEPFSANLDVQTVLRQYRDFSHFCNALRWLARPESTGLYPTEV